MARLIDYEIGDHTLLEMLRRLGNTSIPEGSEVVAITGRFDSNVVTIRCSHKSNRKTFEGQAIPREYVSLDEEEGDEQG